LLDELPIDAQFVLGDLHYNAPNVPDVQARCDRACRTLVTTRYGPFPHTDGGADVRRLMIYDQASTNVSVGGIVAA